jgi:hypothetical protein
MLILTQLLKITQESKMDNTFIFIAYTVGTLFGLYVGSKLNTVRIIEKTVDDLIAKRIIKTRKLADGEVEILQYDEEK